MRPIIIRFLFLRIHFLCLLLFLGVSSPLLYAQNRPERTISGSITDQDGEPVIGASVKVKGTNQGVSTDINGKYQIRLNPGRVILVFSSVGYDPQEKEINADQQLVNITLAKSESLLDEVVVVGYGTMKKKDLTGSVAHIGKEVIETKVATSMVDFIKGSVAGVRIGVDNSAAGGGSIQVRGPASLRASTSPLIVLDGNIFYGNIADINPNDIESIDILKDASSTAIYGSKGSAGVIMVNTKKGRTDKPTVNLSTKTGLTSLLSAADLPTPEQFLQRRTDYWKTKNFFETDPLKKKGEGYYDNPDNLPEGITKEQWAAYDPSFSGDYTETWLTRIQLTSVEMDNYKLGKTESWRDYVYQTGLRQDYSASVSGRSTKLNYYFSLGRTQNEGYKVGDVFNATRGRLSLDADITKWLTLGTNTQFADRGNNEIVANTDAADHLSPYGSMYEADGSLRYLPTGDLVQNPLLANQLDRQFNKAQTLTSTLYSKISLPFDISFQTNFNNRFGWRKQYYYTSDIRPGVPKGGEASRDEFSDYEWILDNMLKWNHSFGIHRFDATFVASSEKYQLWETDADNEGFIPNGYLGFHNLKAGTNPLINSNDEIQTGNSLLGRLNYTLMDRYILTASVRRDGFSAFGTQNPYGVYPAFAAAWRISDEKFMKNSGVNNLKLRLSWGENGNRDIGRYVALSRLNVTDNIMDGQNVKGVWTDNLANESLKWERTKARNIGLDFGLLRNRLSGIIDVYHNQTNDLILTQALPRIIGYTNVIANLGQVDNKGFELTLNSINLNIPDKINWSTTFTYSTNKNIIKHLYGNTVDVKDSEGNVIGQREDDDIQNGWYIGHGINDILDYKMIGIWQLGEEAEAKKYGKTPGDPKLLDLNNDGVLDNSDKVWLGSKIPKFYMSLRNDLNLFNSFNLAFVFRGEFNYLAVDNLARNDDNRFFDRQNSIMNDYWTPENPSNEYAKLGSNSSSPSVNIYKRRDFVRLQNASLSYSFPKKMLKKFSIDNLRASLNVDNAFVITDWTYFDPETAGTAPRIFTFGLDITL